MAAQHLAAIKIQSAIRRFLYKKRRIERRGGAGMSGGAMKGNNRMRKAGGGMGYNNGIGIGGGGYLKVG